MRTVSLLAVLVLAGALVGFLILGGDEPSGRRAAPLDAGAPAEEAHEGAVSLLGPTESGLEGDEREAASASSANRTAPRPPAAAPRVDRLSGRLVDEAGAPVAGARVAVWTRMHVGGERGEDIELESAGDGRFETQVPLGQSLTVDVQAVGFERLRRTQVSVWPGGLDLGDLALRASAVIDGRVVDARGAGVEGAQLYVDANLGLPSRATLPLLRTSGPPTAVSGADGRFRLGHVPVGPWRLHVWHAEHPALAVRGSSEHAGQRAGELVVELADGASVAGAVLGLPEPVPPLRVVAQFVSGAPAGTADPIDGELVELPRGTDLAADGRFDVRGLVPQAVYRLQLMRPPSQPGAKGAQRAQALEVVAGAGDVTFTYRPGSSLRVRVVRAGADTPIDDYRLTVDNGFREQQLAPASAPPFPDGEARFPDVDDSWGAWLVEGSRAVVSAEGFAEAELELPVVAAGTELDLGTVALEQVPQLRVTVTAARMDTPLPGAKVRCESRDRSWRRDGVTDAEGLAVLDLMPGVPCVVTVTRAGFATETLADVVFPAEDSELEVELGRGGSVRVAVREADGRPAARVSVLRETSDEALGAGLPSELRQRRADAEGLAVFDRLPPGTHRFRAVPAVGWVGSESDWVEAIVENEATAELSIELAPRALVRGRLTEGGEPLAGAHVALRRPSDGVPLLDDPSRFSRASLSERTDSDGRFELEGVPFGPCELYGSHADLALPFVHVFEVVRAEELVTIDLPRTEVSGVVVDGGGRALEGARVRASLADAEPSDTSFTLSGGGSSEELVAEGSSSLYAATTDESGRFSLRGVPVGREVVLVAEPPASDGFLGSARSEPLSLEAGEHRRDLRLELPDGGSLRVEPVDSRGAPSNGCFVVLEPGSEAQGEIRHGYVGDEGGLTFASLAPGPWTVRVQRLGSSEKVEVAVDVVARRHDTLPVVLSQ